MKKDLVKFQEFLNADSYSKFIVKSEKVILVECFVAKPRIKWSQLLPEDVAKLQDMYKKHLEKQEKADKAKLAKYKNGGSLTDYLRYIGVGNGVGFYIDKRTTGYRIKPKASFYLKEIKEQAAKINACRIKGVSAKVETSTFYKYGEQYKVTDLIITTTQRPKDIKVKGSHFKGSK